MGNIIFLIILVILYIYFVFFLIEKMTGDYTEEEKQEIWKRINDNLLK